MSQSIMSALKRLHLAMEQYGKMQMSHTDLTPAQAALLYYLLTHEDQGNCGIQLMPRWASQNPLFPPH